MTISVCSQHRLWNMSSFSWDFLVLALQRNRWSRDPKDLEVLHCDLVLPISYFTGTEDCPQSINWTLTLCQTLPVLPLNPITVTTDCGVFFALLLCHPKAVSGISFKCCYWSQWKYTTLLPRNCNFSFSHGRDLLLQTSDHTRSVVLKSGQYSWKISFGAYDKIGATMNQTRRI